tara:strand:- start:4739 stop:5002 length:264 start_codon:yes stop_codon:yes gene_type:complete
MKDPIKEEPFSLQAVADAVENPTQFVAPSENEVILAEVEALNGLIAEMSQKVEEAAAAQQKLVIVRDALQANLDIAQLQTELDLGKS